MLEYDDIFDEDYCQYNLPWDGKAKIKIDPNIVGPDPQQLSMKVLLAPLRLGMVYPPKQPTATQPDPSKTHGEERWPADIEPSK